MRKALWISIFGGLLMLASGCISPTASMKKNAAGITDLSMEIDKSGAKPGSPITKTLIGMAVTNETIMCGGILPVDQRIPVTDLPALEANRKQAEADNEKGGAWTITGSFALDLAGTVAGLFGLGAVGSILKTKAGQLAEYKKKADGLEAAVTGREDQIRTVVGGIANFVEKVDPEIADKLKEAIRSKANEPARKVEFDKAVSEALGGGA